MASTSTVSTPGDLSNLLPLQNGTITIGPNTLPGSSLGDVLTAFNGGNSLRLATTSFPALLTDGVTLSGTTAFLGSQTVQVTASFKVNGDFLLTATLTHLTLSALTSGVKDLTLPHGMGIVDLGTVQVIAAHADDTLTLTAAASNAIIGEFAFKAKRPTPGARPSASRSTLAALPHCRD